MSSTSSSNDTPVPPPLWNPNAAASWSLVFTPVFGALLHMKNWQALGETKRAHDSRLWAIGSTTFFLIAGILSMFWEDSKSLDAAMRGGGIGLLVGWYYASGKAQQAFVLARFGKKYPRRGWIKPLLCALFGLIAFLAVLFVVALVHDAIAGVA